MKNIVDIVLFLVAAVLFALAVFKFTEPYQHKLIAAGLFCCAFDWWLHALGVG